MNTARRFLRLLCLVGFLALGVGCSEPETPPPTGADSLAVGQPAPAADSLAAAQPAPARADSADVAAVAADSAQIAPPPGPVLADTTTLPSLGTAAPGPDVVAALDSLQQQVAALTASVEAMRRINDRLLLNQLTQAEAPDTTSIEENLIEANRERFQSYVWRIFLTIVVLGITYYLVQGTVWLLDISSERSATRRLFYKRLIPIIRIIVWGYSIYLVVHDIFGIGTDKLFAASAALGVAIGFAAQDILKNLFGGLVIILDQPFQVGDKIDVGGTYGEVVSIGLRSTRIVTPDDNLVSVPNAQIVDGQVSNANAGNLDCQVVTKLFLPGWVDVMKAKAIAHAAAANSKYVFLDKPIVVIVKDEFKETFLTQLLVKAYVIDTRYESVFVSDVTEAAKSEFLKHNMLWPIWGAETLHVQEDIDLAKPPPPPKVARSTSSS